MRKITTFVILTIAVLLPACSLLPQTAKQKVADGVNKYCATLSAAERMTFRTEVNSLIAPNSVQVNCAADATK